VDLAAALGIVASLTGCDTGYVTRQSPWGVALRRGCAHDWSEHSLLHVSSLFKPRRWFCRYLQDPLLSANVVDVDLGACSVRALPLVAFDVCVNDIGSLPSEPQRMHSLVAV
jgi:hypothetical protein